MRAVFAALIFLSATPSHAHGEATLDWNGPALWVHALIVLAAVLYARGLRNLWSSARPGHGVSLGGAAAFIGGLVLLALLVSEVVERSTRASFAAHMVQHELLMLVVAPLLIAGRSLATWSWALPASTRGPVGRAFAHRGWSVAWTALTSSLGATITQLALLAAWHVPAAFDRAASNAWMHALQHTSFLVPALAFWWSVAEARRRRSAGTAIAALFVMMVTTGALGALLTFAPSPWYASALTPAEALADQQLGGLVMWVPGGIAYVLAALWLLAGMLARDARHERFASAARP